MEKKIVYDKYDAGKALCFGMFAPQILAFFVAMIVSLIGVLAGLKNEEITKNSIVLVVFMLITPFAFWFSFYMTNKISHTDWKKATGFSFKLDWLNVLYCVGISLCCVFGFNYLIAMFDEIVALTGFKGNYDIPLPLSNIGWLFLNILLMGLLPAIFEELLFRGVIFNGLKQYSIKTAVFGSALLFALIHGGIEQALYPFIVGTILAVVMLKTSNIIYPMIVHFCNNSLVLIFNFIMVQTGNTETTAFSFTWYNILIAIFATLLACGLIFVIYKYLLKSKKVEEQPKPTLKLEDFSAEENATVPTKMYQPNANIPNKWLIVGIVFGVVVWIIDLISGFVA